MPGELSAGTVRDALAEHGYLADEGLATAVFLALRLERPLLLEGDAGVGKTELARVIADWTGGPLLRLQCYEGIDVSQAVYEWDYPRQLLHLRAAEVSGRAEEAGSGGAAGSGNAGGSGGAAEEGLYAERFLIRRALLTAISDRPGPPPVLLIDEVDRADDEFEAFLLEFLAEYAFTVPELGTITAARPPRVLLTSNRSRDLHDALKRRCLYHWVTHPEFEREVAIIRLRLPDVLPGLAAEVAAAAQALRGLHLYKPPGIAETIDWAAALAALGRRTLDERSIELTMGVFLKYAEDQARVRDAGLGRLMAAAAGPPGTG